MTYRRADDSNGNLTGFFIFYFFTENYYMMIDSNEVWTERNEWNRN